MSSTSFSDSLEEVNEILRLYDGSTSNGYFQYDGQRINASKSSPNSTLDSIKNWNYSDFLHFDTDYDPNYNNYRSYDRYDNSLNDSDITKVCQALMEHLTTKKPPLFALTLNNSNFPLTTSYLDLLESLVMRNLSEVTRTIIRIMSPANDLIVDWVIHLNSISSVAIDYFRLKVDNYALKNGFLESFASPCCSIKVFDIVGFKTKPEQFDKVIKFFSTYQTSVLRLRCAEVPGTENEILDKLTRTVSVAAKNGLLMSGIQWWNGSIWRLLEVSAADKAIAPKRKLADAKASLISSSQNLNKLVFVGESASGKSSVLRSLEGKSFEKLVSSKTDDQAIESMHLVALTSDNKKPWAVKKETSALLGYMKNGKEQYLNVVDINGAKHFSMLPKLAITNKTLIVYCVKVETLLNNESGEIEKICNALIIVERLAPGCAIVIATTFAAMVTEDILNNLNLSLRKAVFAQGIKRLFPNILSRLYFHPLENSSAGNAPKMIESLRYTIFTIVTGHARFNQEVPDFYPLFIGHIKDLWIKIGSLVYLSEVEVHGKQGGLTSKDIEAALAWAHDTGLIQHYGAVDEKFKQIIVINPQFMYQMFQSYLYDGINWSRLYSSFSENGKDVEAYEMGGVLKQDLLLSYWSALPDDQSKLLYDISFHFKLLLHADDPLVNSHVKMRKGQQLLAVPAMMPNWKAFSGWIDYEQRIFNTQHQISGVLVVNEIPIAEAIP